MLGSDQAVAMPLVEEDARETTLSAALDEFDKAVEDLGALDASDLGPFSPELVEAGSRLLRIMGSCLGDDAAVLRFLRSTFRYQGYSGSAEHAGAAISGLHFDRTTSYDLLP